VTDTGSLILDTLALLGGGRGTPLNQVTPHLLGAIFWGILRFCFALLYTGPRNNTDFLLLTSFLILLVTEASMTINSLLHVTDTFVPELVATLWSALEYIGATGGRVLLSAAFLQIVLGQRDLTTRYLKVSLGLIALISLYDQAAPVFSDLGLKGAASFFSSIHIALLSPLTMTVLLGFAIARILSSLRKIRWPILMAMCCFFLESVLSIVINQPDSNLSPILAPIRGNLHLWAIPFVAYVALRVRHVEGQRLEHGIQSNERLEALGQLSSGIAHDFNNHLQIILGYTELAKSTGNLDSKLQLPLNRIEEAAESAGALVNQLLAFSRGQPPKFEPVNLNEVVTRLMPMLSRLLGPDIRLMHDLDLDTKKILANIPMIEQIIINLVVNAKDAIEGNGAIAIQSRSLSQHDPSSHTGEAGYERTQLLVGDTGLGIDEKTIHRVFEPFFTTKPVGEGTGLGLSTVYSAVQKHNGTVFIKSEIGKFTRVYIEFPVCEQPALFHETTPAMHTLSAVRGETILLAEDETSIRDLASTLLQDAGYNVLAAQDGQHAIDIMRDYNAPIDLCLFDVTMPVLNGYDTYDCVAAHHPDTPVLFITGNTSRVAHVRNHLPHLQKPFSNYDLFRLVRQLLDEAATA